MLLSTSAFVYNKVPKPLSIAVSRRAISQTQGCTNNNNFLFKVQSGRKVVAAELRNLQELFQAPTSVSLYNKGQELALSNSAMDHDGLRDACDFLVLASDALEGLPTQEAIRRLLFNEVCGSSN